MVGLRRGCSEGGEGCASEEQEAPCTWALPRAAGWTLGEGQDREPPWGPKGHTAKARVARGRRDGSGRCRPGRGLRT